MDNGKTKLTPKILKDLSIIFCKNVVNTIGKKTSHQTSQKIPKLNTHACHQSSFPTEAMTDRCLKSKRLKVLITYERSNDNQPTSSRPSR